MRLPKTVRINNITFKVVKDNKRFGSHFSYNNATITIGAKGSSREILDNLIHEVGEISTVERGMRGKRCRPQTESDEFIFHGSHKDFNDVITDISGVVGDLMKLE